MRRMDRYSENTNTSASSRINKNQELYQNFSTNSIYTNITDVTNANAYEINNNKTSHTTREEYQNLRKFQDVEPLPRNKKELEDVNYLYQRKENKVYDINSVLEEARKNKEKDALEEKRKLKNNAYNILSGSNKKKLEEYREEKKKRLTTPEEEEIRELIDTIASKTLAGEIDKETSVDLLSDLMATNVLDKVDPQKVDEPTITEVVEVTEEVVKDDDDEKIDEKLSLSKEILDKDQVKKINDTTTGNLSIKEQFERKDDDFYTRSMDLSDKDFNLKDDFKDKQLPLVVKILIFLLVVAVVAATVYFIHQKIM